MSLTTRPVAQRSYAAISQLGILSLSILSTGAGTELTRRQYPNPTKNFKKLYYKMYNAHSAFDIKTLEKTRREKYRDGNITKCR
jgi:hypothetical protein